MHNNHFLHEAINVGNQLLGSAIRGKHGLSWETLAMDNNQKIALATEENLYSGVSGIALFLIELHKQTHDEKYLLASEEALAWVERYCNAHPETDNYALLTGRMGVAYAFLQLYNATNKNRYLQKALAFATPSKKFLREDIAKEYINGNAGALLGLLHLHAASQEPWLLELIDAYAQVLLEGARLDRNGIWWDAGPQQIRPLCGFSHGASGIGFVLMELGHYLNNSTFYLLADQAFAYENAYFDTKTGNWPDFRLRMWKKEQIAEMEEAYQAGRFDIFRQPRDMTAWCHGAPGIGLARIRAYELSGKKTHLEDARRALAKVRQTGNINHHTSFSLCHGIGGNAETLIEGYAQLGNRDDLRLAQQWGDAAIRQKQQSGWYVSGMGKALVDRQEDASLLNGSAGIGYFYLRLHNPDGTPSILAPKLAAKMPQAAIPKNLPFLCLQPAELQKYLINKAFPKSLKLAEQYAPAHTERQLKKSAQSPPWQAFGQLMDDLPEAAPPKQKHHITDVFSLESYRLELETRHPSNGLLYIEACVCGPQAAKLVRLPDSSLLHSTLKFAEHARLFVLENQEYHLLKFTISGVEDQKISQFCYVALEAFRKELQVSQAIHKIDGLYGLQDASGKKMLQQKVLSQVRVALSYGALQLQNTNSIG